MVKHLSAIALLCGFCLLPTFAAAEDAVQTCTAQAEDMGLNGQEKADYVDNCVADMKAAQGKE